MDVKHRIQLVDLLKEWKILGPAAEVGVAEGNFSRDLLTQGIPKLYMVDNWSQIPGITGDGNSPQLWHDKNYRRALQQVEPFADRTIILKGLSVAMAKRVADESLSLVYLDADHSYEGVLADLYAWYPKLIKGGVMAGHDFLSPQYGVKKAVREFTYDHKLFVHVIPEDKEEDAGFYFEKRHYANTIPRTV